MLVLHLESNMALTIASRLHVMSPINANAESKSARASEFSLSNAQRHCASAVL